MNLIYLYYAFLRKVGLRKKAKITPHFDKDGMGVMFEIDKLDPGESVIFPGEFVLGKPVQDKTKPKS